MMRRVVFRARRRRPAKGAVFAEYLVLLTVVGIGVVAGIAAVRLALITEIGDLFTAIANVTCPP